jgi:hypothetical protein
MMCLDLRKINIIVATIADVIRMIEGQSIELVDKMYITVTNAPTAVQLTARFKINMILTIIIPPFGRWDPRPIITSLNKNSFI